MNFLEDFELEDNAIIGGAAGFVEESVEKEQLSGRDNNTSEPPDYSSTLEEDPKIDRLKLLYNQNPNLALHIVNRFIEHKRFSKINAEFIAVMAEIEDEIEQMKEEEENADKNDS